MLSQWKIHGEFSIDEIHLFRASLSRWLIIKKLLKVHFQRIIGISVVGVPKPYDLFVTNTFFTSLTGDKNLRTMRLMQIGTQWPQKGGIKLKWTWIQLKWTWIQCKFNWKSYFQFHFQVIWKILTLALWYYH